MSQADIQGFRIYTFILSGNRFCSVESGAAGGISRAKSRLFKRFGSRGAREARLIGEFLEHPDWVVGGYDVHLFPDDKMMVAYPTKHRDEIKWTNYRNREREERREGLMR